MQIYEVDIMVMDRPGGGFTLRQVRVASPTPQTVRSRAAQEAAKLWPTFKVSPAPGKARKLPEGTELPQLLGTEDNWPTWRVSVHWLRKQPRVSQRTGDLLAVVDVRAVDMARARRRAISVCCQHMPALAGEEYTWGGAENYAAGARTHRAALYHNASPLVYSDEVERSPTAANTHINPWEQP